MRTHCLALFIITLTVVALPANSQMTPMHSSIRDAAMEIHPCLNQNVIVRRFETVPSGATDRILIKFGSFGACEAAVSIECIVVESDQLFSCHALDNRVFDFLVDEKMRPDGAKLHDAPAHSQEPTALQLIQEEMGEPVTRE